MKFRFPIRNASITTIVALCLVPKPGQAQQLSVSSKANLNAPAVATSDPASTPTPRTTDGHPNLSGVWYHREPGPVVELRSGGNIVYEFAGIEKDPDAKIVKGNDHPSPAKDNLPVYKPEYQTKLKELKANLAKTDSAWSCAPPGVPRVGVPHQIVQGNNEVVFLYSDLNGSYFRVVPIDGRPKSSVHRIDRSYFGDSYGHWEGDTLVVDVDNMNDDTWLSDNGLFHSTALHVVERLTRKGNTLTYEAKAEDPKVLAEPWTLPTRTLTLSDEPIYEAPPCVELDSAHIIGDGVHDNVR